MNWDWVIVCIVPRAAIPVGEWEIVANEQKPVLFLSANLWGRAYCDAAEWGGHARALDQSSLTIAPSVPTSINLSPTAFTEGINFAIAVKLIRRIGNGQRS